MRDEKNKGRATRPGRFRVSLFDRQCAAIAFLAGDHLVVCRFREEMSYRGYLLNRVAGFFGGTRAGWIIAAILSSALFGLGHSYQGIVGVIDISLTALIPVVAYLATGRNLWVPIILHGTGDTIGFLLIFFHRYSGL